MNIRSSGHSSTIQSTRPSNRVAGWCSEFHQFPESG